MANAIMINGLGGSDYANIYEFIDASFRKWIDGQGFTLTEFTNSTTGTNITIPHSLGSKPTKIIMWIKSSDEELNNSRYYVGICTNPNDQGSTTNNTFGLKIATSFTNYTAYNSMKSYLNKDLLMATISQNSQYTFITSATSSTEITIRNGTSVQNALGNGTFVVAYKL